MPEATYNPTVRAWSALAWTPVVATAQVPKILASAPVLLFLLALTAMLFRPPELACSSLDRVAFLLLLVAFLLRCAVVRQPLRLERTAVWPLGVLLLMSLVSVANATLRGQDLERACRQIDRSLCTVSHCASLVSNGIFAQGTRDLCLTRPVLLVLYCSGVPVWCAQPNLPSFHSRRGPQY